VWVFVDGVGLAAGAGAEAVEAAMPFMGASLGPNWARAGPPRVGPLARLWPTATGLGVTGLPQTATGQVTLLTAANAAALMGRHVPAFPGPRLRRRLDEGNLLAEVAEQGRTVALLNAYRRPPARETAIQYAARTAGARRRSLADAAQGLAVPSDLGVFETADAAGRDPRAAARAMAGAVRACAANLCVFEYSLPDLVGHGRLSAPAARVLSVLDGFLEGVHAILSPVDRLVWTGDHGNLEAPGRRHHTAAPVPTVLWPADAAPPDLDVPDDRFDLVAAGRLLRRLAGLPVAAARP
jgi:2,3-bisphosphoglycerate-independent phosphoglycerate mutase